MARTSSAWVVAAFVVAACAAVAVSLWAAALRQSDHPVTEALLCQRYADLRERLVDEGLGADAALRTRTIELAEAAKRYPDDDVKRSGEALAEVITAPDATAADVRAAARPVAPVCRTASE